MVRYWRKKREYNGQCISYLPSSRNPVIFETGQNILIEVGTSLPMKLIRLVNMCVRSVKFIQINICLMHFLFRMVWTRG
jgi:hypothetical protein